MHHNIFVELFDEGRMQVWHVHQLKNKEIDFGPLPISVELSVKVVVIDVDASKVIL